MDTSPPGLQKPFLLTWTLKASRENLPIPDKNDKNDGWIPWLRGGGLLTSEEAFAFLALQPDPMHMNVYLTLNHASTKGVASN